VPPAGSALLKCENGVAKGIGKLMAAVVKCHIGRASGKTTDDMGEDACEQAALLKFGTKTKTAGCGSCTNLGNIATAVEGIVDSNNGQVYCAAGTPFGGDDTGNIPADAPTGPMTKCENAVAKGVAKLAGGVVKCHIARASGKTTADTFEDACESAAMAKFTTKTKTTTCDSCTDLNAIAQSIANVVDANNGLAYCQ